MMTSLACGSDFADFGTCFADFVTLGFAKRFMLSLALQASSLYPGTHR